MCRDKAILQSDDFLITQPVRFLISWSLASQSEWSQVYRKKPSHQYQLAVVYFSFVGQLLVKSKKNCGFQLNITFLTVRLILWQINKGLHIIRTLLCCGINKSWQAKIFMGHVLIVEAITKQSWYISGALEKTEQIYYLFAHSLEKCK